MIVPVATIFDPEGSLWAWSNFALFTMTCEGLVYASVEHCFQAAKFPSSSTFDEIRQTASPADAKALAWERDSEKRADWEDVRYLVMKRAVECKCLQWDRFRQQLVRSYPFPIIESSKVDSEWGIGPDCTGKNLWGKCAMQTRSEMLQVASSQYELRIPMDTHFGKQSQWALLRGSCWNVPRAIIPDESFRCGSTGVMARDIVELVEVYLNRQGVNVRIPKWSKEPHYSYKSGTLRLGKNVERPIDKRTFDAARAFAYQSKYEKFSAESDSRSCIPRWNETFFEIISSELKGKNTLPILVIGAGVGDEPDRLWRHFGSDALLSEISEGFAANCKLQAPSARVRVGVAEDLSDLESESIGSYFALRTLESMFLDKRAALKEACRVLRRGGVLGISISCAYNVNGALQKGRFVNAEERDLAGGAEDILDTLQHMELAGLRALTIYDLESEWLIIGERPE